MNSALAAMLGLTLSIILIVKKVSPVYSLILGALIGGLLSGCAILNMVIDICHTEFEFDNFNEVMDYFKKMINICKQMNYSKFKSEQYEGFQKQLEELVAERSVK